MTITKEMIEQRVLDRIEEIKDAKLKTYPPWIMVFFPTQKCQACCETKECPYYIDDIEPYERLDELAICKDCAVRARL